jgi:alpha 1,2-mannosyltransferase
LLVLFVSVLASVVLVVVFARDSPEAELITPLTWELPREERQKLKFLPKAQHLKHIWADTQPVAPVKLIRGGESAYRSIREQFAKLGFSGPEALQRGIVLAAGGFHYFASVYVLIRELRYHGCTLPIELWYRQGEMNRHHVQCLKQWGVLCLSLDQHLPFHMEHKFAIKVMAMYLSVFDEILFLDADNNVVKDPSFLFDAPEYREHEALFWPDFWPLMPNAPCYDSFPEGFQPHPHAYQQESGQMVVNRQRYWKQLWFVFRILENHLEGLFPAPFNHGDKDLFHITWDATGEKYNFIQHRTASVATEIVNPRRKRVQAVAMGQHAPDGSLLFVHQNHAEWGDRRPEDTKPWWVHLKRHTVPKGGRVEAGFWNPTGPTKLESFREVVGTMEDIYTHFISDLRAELWYRNYYAKELTSRNLI